MKRQSISNIAFYVTTVVLILIIVLCVGNTVKSESSAETQRIENRCRERELLSYMRGYLNDNGFRNSGVTLTYVADADGSLEYTFTIHHKKIDGMDEAERKALTAELANSGIAAGTETIHYEYLLME